MLKRYAKENAYKNEAMTTQKQSNDYTKYAPKKPVSG